MEFTTGAEILASALTTIKGVVERRKTLPILSNVLLELTGDALTLTGTDLELELQTRRGVAGAQDGLCTVPADRLLALCKAFPEGADVRLKTEEDCLRMASGRSKFKLLTMPASNFPAFDASGFGDPITIPAATLATLVYGSSYCMAKQDVRYYLNGLLLDFAPGVLSVVASDGHRLAIASAALEGLALDRQVIIPGKAAGQLPKLLALGGDVSVALANNSLRFSFADGTQFSAKLIDGKYPDVKRVLPNDFSSTMDVTRAALIDSLKRVAITAADVTRAVSVELTADGIALSSGQEDTAEDFVPGVLEGAPVTLGFNAGYLLDALAHLEGETARISIARAGNSSLIVDPESDLSRHVVMPMRL